MTTRVTPGRPRHFPARHGRRLLHAAVWATALCLSLGISRAEDEEDGLPDKDDGGSAAYAEEPAAAPAGDLAGKDIAASYPLAQRARIHVLGGGVRGFGVLASYPGAPPSGVVVTRATTPASGEPYRPISLARVFDPHGNLVAIEDFTDQTEKVSSRVIKLPVGDPGIWRVSFSGGRSGDLVEVRLPETRNWGICGELSLGVTETTPRPAYLWIPPSSLSLLVGIEKGKADGIEIRGDPGGKVLAKPQPDSLRRVARLVLSPAPAGSVCELVLPKKFEGALVIDGAPGLLCPSVEAARVLRGGTVESHGLLVSGPLQARARDWMAAHAGVNRSPSLTFPAKVPKDLASPQLQVLGFEKYGCLNSLSSMVARQNANLDPSSPYFGSGFAPKNPEPATWINFLPGRLRASFFPGGVAAAATFDSPLNPVFHDPDFVTRAALAGLQEIAASPENFLLRESSLFETRFPMRNAFGLYIGGITGPFRELNHLLPNDAQKIWEEGVCAVGDKLADFQSYESNQWAHILKGHLDIYIATGKKRFLGYFERLAPVFLQNRFGPDSKFGLHPAGFYLEEYGPDGNYDNLNSFFMAACYLDYRALPEAKLELVEMFRKAIASNLDFRSLFWLPQPDGTILSPTAFNCRTTANLAGAGYPGTFMVKSEFPLAAARFALTPMPVKGVGPAANYSFVANTPEWIHRVLKDGLQHGPGAFGAEISATGWWVPDLVRAYALPDKAQPALLPFQEKERTWTKPGLFAWKRGNLYGVVFYDVSGATRSLNGFFGGGPTALWTSVLGSLVNSTSPYGAMERPEGKSDKGVKRIYADSINWLDAPEKITFSCVYGHDGQGRLFYTGKERAAGQGTPDGGWEVTAQLAEPKGSLKWTYHTTADGMTLEVSLRMASPIKDAYLSLPLWTKSGELKVAKAADDAVTVSNSRGSARFEWQRGLAGSVELSVIDGLERLVIALPRDGTPLRLTLQVAESETPSEVLSGQGAARAPAAGAAEDE